MANLRIALGRRAQVADGTWAFELRLLGQEFLFKPGQSLDLTYSHAPSPDPRGHTRPFSIANGPGADHLVIATRIRQSPFKQDLLDAAEGTELQVAGPFGDFTLPKSADDVVMIAGGIGVTPFRSMLEDASARALELDLSLIHSNRTPEETPFLNELKRWTTGNRRFTYLPTMTQMEKSQGSWIGARRRIDAAFLDEVLDEQRGRALYMLAGPARFVTGMRAALEQAGVPDDRVRSEDFPGY